MGAESSGHGTDRTHTLKGVSHCPIAVRATFGRQRRAGMIIIERKELGYTWEVHHHVRGVIAKGSAVDYIDAVSQAEEAEWREVREKEVQSCS